MEGWVEDGVKKDDTEWRMTEDFVRMSFERDGDGVSVGASGMVNSAEHSGSVVTVAVSGQWAQHPHNAICGCRNVD